MRTFKEALLCGQVCWQWFQVILHDHVARAVLCITLRQFIMSTGAVVNVRRLACIVDCVLCWSDRQGLILHVTAGHKICLYKACWCMKLCMLGIAH